MKTGYAACLLFCALVGGKVAAQEDALATACHLAYQQLSRVPNESLSRTFGEFEDAGRSYRGCILRLAGNRSHIDEEHDPASLFYPTPGTSRYREGWRGDREADGKDGTFFRITKQGVFCLVRGSWEGGDDSDPTYVPSPRYDVTVMCAAAG